MARYVTPRGKREKTTCCKVRYGICKGGRGQMYCPNCETVISVHDLEEKPIPLSQAEKNDVTSFVDLI